MIGTVGKEIEDLISRECTGYYLTKSLEMEEFVEISDEELYDLIIEDLEPLCVSFIRELIESSINFLYRYIEEVLLQEGT